ncbi:PilX N-terminal domain-containing pilus assembly protein [Colwellia sp. E2M01]|uniref:PilX N-terminal domain-containing pilus assembly protein n=1 Tax=Colwellia sp. E2M01 TaxID=2841561 RepID=UPI001C08241A|nr:PilX N-terminal domain-containing pilus assembly protein [Colwellia sp. E2M01]MBU2869394.1 hypothetical protein [Colwellia sp. E2M01]
MKKIFNFPSPRRNQKGVVLIVSLVFLVALTAVAAALMQNSTVDMKMSGASEEKTIALQEVISAVDEVIFNQVTAAENRFSRPVTGEDNFPIVNQGVLLPGTSTQANARVDVVRNGYNLDKDCPRMKPASSVGQFGCSLLRVTVDRDYGRTGLSNISTESGIAQQLLK